jgi:hypothetical protein
VAKKKKLLLLPKRLLLKRLLLKWLLRWKLRLLKKLRLLPKRLLPKHLPTLHPLKLLPSNSGSGTKNRPSGRFFYACSKRSRRIVASTSMDRGWV